MEEELRAELSAIKTKIHSWQTKPLKAKIEMIRSQSFQIKHNADRATPVISLDRNALE